MKGYMAWYKLGYEQNTMTAQRMQGLAGKVYGPKRLIKYGDANAAIEEWEITVKLFE